MKRKQPKVAAEVATIYVSPLLQRGTVRVMGAEVDPALPDGCVGVMFVYSTREAAVLDAGGREPICMERVVQAATPAKRKRKGGR